MRRLRSGQKRGFTLIESALVTVIVGVGVVSLLALLAAGSVQTRETQLLTTAQNLISDLHELTLGLKFRDPASPMHWGPEGSEATGLHFNDIDDLANRTFAPPIDARRQVLTNLEGWFQQVTVETVDADRLTLTVPSGTDLAARVTVVAGRNGREVARHSWLVFDAGQ